MKPRNPYAMLARKERPQVIPDKREKLLRAEKHKSQVCYRGVWY
jgi:hypothetical protein